VAIEALSFSRNLEKSVTNIVDALDVGSVLVVADDVFLEENGADDIDDSVRPSVVPHASWLAAFRAAGCTVVAQRDLSLQYELSGACDRRKCRRWSVPLRTRRGRPAFGGTP